MPSRIRLFAMLATLTLGLVTVPVSNAAPTTYNNAVLGVQLQHPAAAAVLEDQQVGDTFGFTLVDTAFGSTHQPLLLRVAQVQGTTTPEQKARDLRAQFADLPLQQQSVSFGRLQGIAVTGVPGEYNATTYVYVRANNRVYEIIYGRDTLDERGMGLLNGLRFSAPRATVASLRLPSAKDTVQVTPPVEVQQQAAQADAALAQAPVPDLAEQAQGSATAQTQAAGTPGEVVPQNDNLFGAPGCADWPSWKGNQRVPWDGYAWGSGWSKAGPSWYGEGGHRNCNSANMLNDYHAIDFPMYEWNSLYAPAAGRVIYAGWASGGWASAGRVVIIDLGNGYWSGAYHMRSVAVSTGQYVDANTRIGYVGGSSFGRDGYYGNHLHQGLYLNARFYAPNGGVYGGQSVEPHYWRRASDGGVYIDIGRWAWMRY